MRLKIKMMITSQTLLRKIITWACVLATGLSWQLKAAAVDTVMIQSKSMNKAIRCVVITPESYDNNKVDQYPAVYLLHGYNGNYSDWIKKAPNIQELSDRFDVLIICPDGAKNSWYFDNPNVDTMQCETHIAEEVLPYIDEHYRTREDKEGRAITGLSMGGHGALYLALKHSEKFGAVGSMSGGVDLRPFPNAWELKNVLGTYNDNPENWDKHSVINLLHMASGSNTQFFIDCGMDDFFIEVNRALHEKMMYLNIPHDYTERPGKHDWLYWQNAIVYQIVFFDSMFKKSANKTTKTK